MSLNPDIKSILTKKGVDYLGVGHRDRRKLFKKEKRRLRRQATAKTRESIREETSQLTESVRDLDAALASLRAAESKLQEFGWMEREREFMSEVDQKRKNEITLESVNTQPVKENRKHTNHQVSPPVAPTHLPFSPLTEITTSGRGSDCEFFLRTGACRFGEACRNFHPRPPSSCTLVFPHLFSGAGLSARMVDGREQDVELENDELEVYRRFLEFHEDVYPEVAGFGEVSRFEVCSNQEVQLRGNVFVRFRSPEAAARCLERMNGRWYDHRLVTCEFSCVQDFSRAICQVETAGRSQSRKFKVCLKGKNCNFWHVFRKTEDYSVFSYHDK